MALKMNIPVGASLIGVAVDNCYLRIVGFSGDKGGITYDVAGYMSPDARAADAREVAWYRMQVGIPAEGTGDLLPWLYEQLKLNELFADAVDC